MLLLGPSALADDAFAARLGAAAARIRLVAPWLPARALPPPGRRFARDFRARYGAAPTSSAVYGYEAMRLVLRAIGRAGARGDDRMDVTRGAFAPAARGSALGAFAVDAAGDTSLHAFGAYAVRGGRLAFLRLVDTRAP